MVIVILLFIAGKLMIHGGSKLLIQFEVLNLEEPLKIDPGISLAIVMTLLLVGVVWSLIDAKKNNVEA
jgi:predicted tellurium resistance membrane protein TerC